MQDNTAFLTNLNGELIDIEWSTEGATATDGFCSLIFENNVYIFGKGSSLEKTNFDRREIFWKFDHLNLLIINYTVSINGLGSNFITETMFFH